jgi:hypothetical protein
MNTAIILIRTILQTITCIFVFICMHAIASIMLIKRYNKAKIKTYISSIPNNRLTLELASNRNIFSNIIKDDYKSFISPKKGINIITLQYPKILINDHYYFKSGIFIPKYFLENIKNIPEIKSKIDCKNIQKKLISELIIFSQPIIFLNQNIKIILYEKDLIYLNIEDRFLIKLFPWQKFSQEILKKIEQSYEQASKNKKIKKKNILCFDLTAFDKKKIIYETIVSKEII